MNDIIVSTSECLNVFFEFYCFLVKWKCHIVVVLLPYHLKRDLLGWGGQFEVISSSRKRVCLVGII